MSKPLKGMIGFLAIVLLYLSACESPNTTFEESIEPYMELQAIEEASNSSITVNQGETHGLDSYFAFDIGNIQQNGFISEGLVEGWCLEWNKAIRQNNDLHAGVEMFNTRDSKSWKPANYLMNIRKDLKAEDSDLTYREIQVALWSLIETPAFDVDRVLQEGNMPSRMMQNGSPNFDVDKVKQIVSRVRSEVSGFEYKPGTKALVFAKTSSDQQNVGGAYGETAWAFSPNDEGEVDENISTEFCGNKDVQGNRWGWYNGTYNSGSSATLDLYAGAGNCDIQKGQYVGTFSFTYENGVLDYTLDLNVDNDFDDLHIHVGENPLPLHNGNSNKYSPAPGGFDYLRDIDIDADSDPLEGEIDGLDGPIYIAVHLG